MRASRGSPSDKQRDKALEQEAQRKLANMRAVLSTAAGREVLCDIIESGGVFTPTRGDLHDSGRLSLALAVFNTARMAAPGMIGQMLGERESRALRGEVAKSEDAEGAADDG